MFGYVRIIHGALALRLAWICSSTKWISHRMQILKSSVGQRLQQNRTRQVQGRKAETSPAYYGAMRTCQTSPHLAFWCSI
jgi:hypothetical protein